MFLNDKKGWYGNFSTAGKNSAYRYVVITRQMKKSKSTPDIIIPSKSPNKKQVKPSNDEVVDIFNIENPEIASLSPKGKKIGRPHKRQIIQKAYNPEKLKYHLKHKKEGTKIKKPTSPGCNKYNPKFSVVHRRSPTSIPWKTLTSRKDLTKYDNTKFYINQSDINENKAGKSFINMSKQLDRSRQVNSRRAQSCINVHRSNVGVKKSIRPQSDNLRIIQQQKEKEYNNNNSDKSNTTSSAVDSYNEFKGVYCKVRKNKSADVRNAKGIKGINWRIRKKEKKKKIKAPNFDYSTSRDYINRISNEKKAVIPFSLPNFKHVRERPIMMVVYDRIKHKKLKRTNFEGIDLNMNYVPDKVITKINNHRVVHPPNFEMMTSRPDDSDPLPSYMKQIYSRSSAYETTALSLKMNNFANGQFLDPFSAFWPKKSFNKFVNMNLLRSRKFIENVVGSRKAVEERKDLTGKAMKFYNKDYNKLLKDEVVSKFDNVTYKSNMKSNSLDMRDMERFLYNYQ